MSDGPPREKISNAKKLLNDNKIEKHYYVVYVICI